ncbi:MAG: hypothetical protein ACLP8S_03820 [Solirubrobacteraceae bacterium]
MKIINRTTATDPPWSTRVRRQLRTIRTGLLADAALAAAAAILLAGCGGSSGGSVAHVNSSASAKTSSTSTIKSHLLTFAQCMRSHGVPNFPDPSSSGQLQLPSSVNPESPAYETAANDCKSFGAGATPKAITQTPQMQAAALKMARCMRSDGVPNFLDGPITRSSGIQRELARLPARFPEVQ